jgi:hypothetical protein
MNRHDFSKDDTAMAPSNTERGSNAAWSAQRKESRPQEFARLDREEIFNANRKK